MKEQTPGGVAVGLNALLGQDCPPGLREPWTWVQPEGLEEVMDRLADARDFRVPDMERENMCSVAHYEMRKLQKALRDVVGKDQLFGHTATSGNVPTWHDGPCAEIARRALQPNAGAVRKNRRDESQTETPDARSADFSARATGWAGGNGEGPCE